MSIQTSVVAGLERSSAVLFSALLIGVMLVTPSDGRAQELPEGVFTPDQFREEVPRGETVRSRRRPEVDPVGLRAGSFIFFPSLGQGIEFNDNIFAQDQNEKSDFIYTIAPRLSIQSDWNNHRLAFVLGGDIGFYFDESDENYQDMFGRISSTIEITTRNAVRLNFGARRGHESRGSPNDVGGTEPTLFNDLNGSLQYAHRFNRLSFVAGSAFQRLDFEDVDAGGGGVINNDDRDRTIYRPGLRVTYEVLPGYAAFVRGNGVFVEYDSSTDDNGFERGSKGFDVSGGISIDITGILFGDLFGGYRRRYFDDSRFDTVEGGTFGATLTWIPTQLTTVILTAENEVIDSVSAQSSSFTSSGFDLNVDHELLRNLILSAGAGYRFDNYDGIDREDNNVNARISADYLMNRFIRLRARYRYGLRESNENGRDFSQNSVMLFLTLTP